MVIKKASAPDEALSAKFIIPTVAEQTISCLIGLVISSVISRISSSALASTGQADNINSVVIAIFAFLTVSATVFISHEVGTGDLKKAKEDSTKFMGLAIIFSVAASVLIVALSSPILRLLMPTAEDVLFGESLRYFRVLMIGLPFNVMQVLMLSVFRSYSRGNDVLVCVIITIAVQFGVSVLCIKALGLAEIGAGIGFVTSKAVGTGYLFFRLVAEKLVSAEDLKTMFRFKKSMLRAIVRIGAPIAFESAFVQLGYLIAGTFAVRLSTFDATVYQMLNTINRFMATIPQGTVNVVAAASVGHLLGAGKEKEARKYGLIIDAVSVVWATGLALIVMAFPEFFCGFFSEDPEAIKATASLFWIMLVMNIAGTEINAMDPQLRAGGDVRTVMIVTLIAVWGIRLPLSWLFTFRMNMGVFGLMLANTVALYFRMIAGLIRHSGKKWIKKEL